jgi:nucleoside-diphosphate-sugar epimerase
MAKSQTLDISRAREALSYSPRVSLEDGMDRFAVWWKKKEAGALTPLGELGLET